MTQEQEWLYENSNVFPNEMQYDIQNEYTYSDKEDEYKTYKKPFYTSIQYYGKNTDKGGVIIKKIK